MTVKFGDKVLIVVSPGLVLEVSAMLEEWLTDLSETAGEIDLERESIGMAQAIVARVVEKGAANPVPTTAAIGTGGKAAVDEPTTEEL